MTHPHKPHPDSLSGMHEYEGVAKHRLLLAMAVTGVVMVVEVFGSILTGSLALGSDAGHMFTHLFALIISYTAAVLACKKPCHHRTFGFYRVEILAALFNSLFLFAVTAFILIDGIARLLNPQPVVGFEMFLVALLGLAANGLSILILKDSAHSNLNIKGAFMHMFADTISSVVIIVGAVIVYFTNWYIIDPLLGIGISMLILVWAVGLFKDSVNVLLETAPKGMNIDDISAQLHKQIPQIAAITDMHIWEITSHMYSFTAHIQLDTTDYKQSQQILQQINQILAQKYGVKHTTIQLKLAT
ncbi:MAG: cation diffusion facilitator family transporter [Candidatus Bathyarchaeota archaeon]|nr:cation diffusion facilitator family transporter [Candidatus Bathyarchaeota archaeon]